jgi:hypothetical protein
MWRSASRSVFEKASSRSESSRIRGATFSGDVVSIAPGHRAHVLVELAEVERVAGLRLEERLLDAAQELVKRPERLEPLGQADVVFVEELDSLDGHRFTVPRFLPF